MTAAEEPGNRLYDLGKEVGCLTQPYFEMLGSVNIAIEMA